MVTEEILFKWTPNRSKLLREFWEDYVLVMETLEESQVENPPRLLTHCHIRWYDHVGAL